MKKFGVDSLKTRDRTLKARGMFVAMSMLMPLCFVLSVCATAKDPNEYASSKTLATNSSYPSKTSEVIKDGGKNNSSQGGSSAGGTTGSGGSSGSEETGGSPGSVGTGGMSGGGLGGTSASGGSGSSFGLCEPGEIEDCYPGPSGTMGLGLCKAGTRACFVSADEFQWSPCQDAITPVSEICNNLDDDCDGFVDDGNPEGQQACAVAGQTGLCASGLTYCSNGSMLCLQTIFSQLEQCADSADNDCDGQVDCLDPDCADESNCLPSPICTGQVPIHLQYQGPAWNGFNSLYAWWMPAGLPPRPWGLVSDCIDNLADDGILDCVFQVPHCTSSFEFQVFLPYNRYWGDVSCSPNGGCGSTIGTLFLDIQGIPLQYVLKSNGIKDVNCDGNACDPYPYKNGLVDLIP